MVEGQSKLRFAEVSVVAVVELLMRNCCLIVVVCYSGITDSAEFWHLLILE